MLVLARINILILLCALSASAQLPILSGSVQIQNPSSVPIPATIPGLFEWWSYTNNVAANGVAVTNWIGVIQGLVLTNATVANSPVNTVNGVWFSATGQSLTNHPAQTSTFKSLSTNWTVFVSFVYTNLDPGGAFGINANLLSDNGSDAIFGSTFQSNPKAQPDMINASGGANTIGSAAAYWLKFTDWTFCNSNNANGGTGHMYCWTNGQFSTFAPADPLWTNLNNVGWTPKYNDGSTFLVGSIRHIILYTNTLSAVQVSNLHYWRTNYDGTSP